MLWCWLACQLAMDLWDDGACENIATGLSVAARERGALNLLPFALNYSAAHQLFAGRFDVAEQLIDEADRIIAAAGNARIADFSILLAAWRGDRGKTYQLHVAIIPGRNRARRGVRSRSRGVGGGKLHRQGRICRRGRRGTRAYDPDGLGFNVWVLPELIEAAARNGDLDVAGTAFEHLAERSR